MPLADAPTTDLLDVFSQYDGSVIFRGLTEGSADQPAVLGRIGWIFTSLGAVFVLWGFVLRSRASAGEGGLGEIAKTWIVVAFMVGAPVLMTAAMQAADSIYQTSVGGPVNLTTACVKAAYAMPELTSLFDVLRKSALDSSGTASAAAAQRGQLISQANDGSVLGYLEAFGIAVWDTGADYASDAGQAWNGAVRMATLATGFGSAMLKCLLILLTIGPLYLLLLAAAAVVWFMEQLRYFLAVTGTMMLPLFAGMYSLPAGHPNRQAAHAYVTHMVSLALWPVAWTIGHTGTIVLYDALISLVSGTSRVPDLASALQWSVVTGSGPSQEQVTSAETALGNWFMGNIAGLLGILVGGIGFVAWVGSVSILGPVFLHKLLAAGQLFMAQALGESGRQAVGLGRLAVDASLQGSGTLRTSGIGEGLERAGLSHAEPSGFADIGGSTPAAEPATGIADIPPAAGDSGGNAGPPM